MQCDEKITINQGGWYRPIVSSRHWLHSFWSWVFSFWSWSWPRCLYFDHLSIIFLVVWCVVETGGNIMKLFLSAAGCSVLHLSRIIDWYAESETSPSKTKSH